MGAAAGGATLLFRDVGVAMLLTSEARRRFVARVFGIPRDEQTLLVTTIALGSVAAVAGGFAARLPNPIPLSGSDAAIGGALVNAAFGGLAGAPSQKVPAAGALIVCAVLAHALRPAMSESARDARAVARRARARYGVPIRR